MPFAPRSFTCDNAFCRAAACGGEDRVEVGVGVRRHHISRGSSPRNPPRRPTGTGGRHRSPAGVCRVHGSGWLADWGMRAAGSASSSTRRSERIIIIITNVIRHSSSSSRLPTSAERPGSVLRGASMAYLTTLIIQSPRPGLDTPPRSRRHPAAIASTAALPGSRIKPRSRLR